MRKLWYSLSICTILVALSASGVQAKPAAQSKLKACIHFSSHELEVCTAYWLNSSALALLPYYKFGASSNQARANAARNRLKSRYWGQARQLIVQRVKSWPKGETDVSLPHITIDSIAVVLAINKATLVTRETWQIADDYGEPIYSEDKQVHRITMQRVPGLLVHKWVVTSIR